MSTFNIGQIHTLPVTASEIKKATRHDATLSKVYTYVLAGWPQQVEKKLQPYSTRQTEFSIEDGCLMWGTRVIIPKASQPAVLTSLMRLILGSVS